MCILHPQVVSLVARQALLSTYTKASFAFKTTRPARQQYICVCARLRCETIPQEAIILLAVSVCADIIELPCKRCVCERQSQRHGSPEGVYTEVPFFFLFFLLASSHFPSECSTIYGLLSHLVRPNKRRPRVWGSTFYFPLADPIPFGSRWRDVAISGFWDLNRFKIFLLFVNRSASWPFFIFFMWMELS